MPEHHEVRPIEPNLGRSVVRLRQRGAVEHGARGIDSDNLDLCARLVRHKEDLRE
jgi:hypothetical protein